MTEVYQHEIYEVVKRYADAWVAGDFKTIFDCYHDEIVFHYFGQNPLSGKHIGKTACMSVLKKISEKANRRLVEVSDVLVGTTYGLIIAVEQFHHDGEAVEVERLLRYKVKDNKLSECWVYDSDQRLIDSLLA